MSHFSVNQAQAGFAKTKVQRFADDEGLETFPD
jgi:hypothetical protein